jgi:ABC-type sugar transport system substrate-binding protein
MKRLNIVVSLITDDNDFQLEQAASAQSAVLKLGAGVQIISSGNDAVQQTQQILGFIQDPAKRPDAILAEPVGTGMAQIAKAAVGAGIAWGIRAIGRRTAVTTRFTSWLSLSTSRQLNVSMIMGQNDDMAFGARRAFEELSDAQERDRWLLPFTGCDGVARSGQEWVRQGRLAATVISPRP